MKGIVYCTLMFVLSGFIQACGCEQIDAGHRGVRKTWGEVEDKSLPEGLYFYNPFSSDVIEMDAREQVIKEETEAYSKDVQKVMVKYSLNFYPDRTKMHMFYRDFGYDYHEKIIPQVVQGTMKAVVGKHIAVELISERQKAVDEMSNSLKEALNSRNIFMTRFEIVNLDFDDAFEKAVEEKVIAIQNAEKSKNTTVMIQEQAKQRIISAEADAKAMKIKSDALSQNQNLVNYEAVLKWDGKLPQYMMGNTVPFVNLSK